MDSTIKQHLRSITTLTGVLTVLTIGANTVVPPENTGMADQAWSAQLGTTRIYSRVEYRNVPDTPEHRIAVRLQKRLRKHGSRVSPPINALAAAVKQRQELLNKSLEVLFVTDEYAEPAVWTVSAQRYPLWIQASITATNAEFAISPEQIMNTIETEQVIEVEPPSHAVLKNVVFKEDDEEGVHRAEVEGVAKPGYMMEGDVVAASVAKAFDNNLAEIRVPLKREEGRIINMTGLDLGDLSLWANGLSDYTGSTWSRSQNVRKALDQHVNNTVVMPGETFSFNDTLDGRVTQGNGWYMSKVIFNGGDLEYAPGGGICQASTTVFRAIVNAGFPVVERRAHSLYVSYYKEHGVGIDATIYPGSQDLVFENDSEKPLLIQAYSDGYEAHVNIYGTPDNRTVELEGPYFASTAPKGFTYNGRSVKNNEIVWVQRVHYDQGDVREYQIGSRYRTLPQSLAREFPPVERVHASAPLASMTE